MGWKFNPFTGQLDLVNSSGGGDVVGPSGATDSDLAQFDGTSGKLLKDGLAVTTTVGSPGSDTNIPTEMAVRSAISSSGGGDVSGPASSVDGNITIFSGTSGKLIQDSGVNISDVSANTSARHSALTLAGLLDYLTLSGQEITLNAIDLATDVTGVLPDANVANDITLDNITQITNRSHTELSDIGTNTHAQIDTHIADTSIHFTKNSIYSLYQSVRNETGTTISAGSVVYISGFNNLPLISLGDNTQEINHEVIGVVLNNINNESNGLIITHGILTGIDTDSFSAVGAKLYLGTSGQLVEGEPASGSIVFIGQVIVKDNNGAILIYADPSFDQLSVPSGQNIDVRMGDSVGSNKVSFKNYSNLEVLNIDSNGNLTLSGTVNGRDIATDGSKLDGIEALAEVNNISDINATDLTDGGDSTLHYHSADRDRANHTGTQTAATISDFDTEVSNNTDVAANTSARHSAVTVTDTAEIDLTLTGQDIQASIKAGSIDETKLDTSVNASLDLADSATQPGDLATVATTGSHTDLSNIGTNTHAQIDTHIASTSNPHSVTATQVGLGNVTNNAQYYPGGTDVALADGGTGSSLVDPNADRILFWDDSAGVVTWLAPSTGLTISGTNMTVRTSSTSQTGIVELATTAETQTGTDTARAVTPAGATATFAQLSHTHTASQVTDFDTEVSNNTDVAANTTHRTSTGADHTYIDQSVVSGASPTFLGTNITAIPTTNVTNLSGTNTGDEVSATDSAQGVVELATSAETTTGTDTGRAVTPDGFAGSDYGKRVVGIQVFDYATDTATGDGKAFFRVPSVMNGWNLVAVAANVATAGTTGTTDIQIHNVTDAQDMLSTVITIDSAETDSSTAATPAVINATYDDVATGDKLRIDLDAVSTTPAQGLYVEMVFQLP